MTITKDPKLKELHKKEIEKLEKPSYFLAALEGIRKGFGIFSATTSMVLFVNGILMVGWGSYLPPVVILITVSTGITILLAFAIKEMINYHINQKGYKGLLLNKDQKTDCTDWAEVTRNLFYGFAKGIKNIDFLGVTKLAIDVTHNKILYSTDLKIWAFFCAAINALILSFWALAKYISKNTETIKSNSCKFFSGSEKTNPEQEVTINSQYTTPGLA